MKKNRHKIIDKIEALNTHQALVRKQLKNIEDKKSEYSEKTFERKQKRLTKQIEKIRKKIHKLELELKECQ